MIQGHPLRRGPGAPLLGSFQSVPPPGQALRPPLGVPGVIPAAYAVHPAGGAAAAGGGHNAQLPIGFSAPPEFNLPARIRGASEPSTCACLRPCSPVLCSCKHVVGLQATQVWCAGSRHRLDHQRHACDAQPASLLTKSCLVRRRRLPAAHRERDKVGGDAAGPRVRNLGAVRRCTLRASLPLLMTDALALPVSLPGVNCAACRSGPMHVVITSQDAKCLEDAKRCGGQPALSTCRTNLCMKLIPAKGDSQDAVVKVKPMNC